MGNYFGLSGRIGRRTYWLCYILPAAITGLIAGVVDVADSHTGTGMGPASLPCALFWLWPGTAGMVKRCHDHDKSGWWMLLALVPFVGAFWSFIELGCLRGSDGPNEHGDDPLSPPRFPAYA